MINLKLTECQYDFVSSWNEKLTMSSLLYNQKKKSTLLKTYILTCYIFFLFYSYVCIVYFYAVVGIEFFWYNLIDESYISRTSWERRRLN